MAEQEYERLTRTGPRSAFELISLSRASIWLGKDHLLCVGTNGYSEDYKRFYFRDIQAIVIRQNNARNVRSGIYAALGVLFVIVSFAVDKSNVALITLLSAAGISLAAVTINLLLGPTCSCQIRTAVQMESLPLIRTRRAQKFLERVRPLIAAAQGQLTAEEITARMQQPAGGVASASAQEPIRAAQTEPTEVQGNEVQSGEGQSNLDGRAEQALGAPGQWQDALPGAIKSQGSRSNRDATTDSDAPPSAVS
jgi:hypothetical protein